MQGSECIYWICRKRSLCTSSSKAESLLVLWDESKPYSPGSLAASAAGEACLGWQIEDWFTKYVPSSLQTYSWIYYFIATAKEFWSVQRTWKSVLSILCVLPAWSLASLSLQGSKTSLFCLRTTFPGELSYIYSNYSLSLMLLTLGKVLYITEQMCQDLFMLSFASTAYHQRAILTLWTYPVWASHFLKYLVKQITWLVLPLVLLKTPPAWYFNCYFICYAAWYSFKPYSGRLALKSGILKKLPFSYLFLSSLEVRYFFPKWSLSCSVEYLKCLYWVLLTWSSLLCQSAPQWAFSDKVNLSLV